MKLQVNDRLNGFTVTAVREARELHGALVEMTHDRTGTPLIWLDNGDTNKVFSITFKTLPENSTGVFHILEHSTLCGSEKYPVREPFVELLKSSMNTFLNAMTAQDWTTYPVSSRNDRDYLNLAEVYLDAVFAPRLLTDPNVFYQEGWHIEQEDDHLIYKGVVFNEMKGAMGDVDELIGQTMLGLMYPDTCYGYNSGGDPAVIPELTYEQYCDTYRRFYHPSNACVYLDGAVPLEQTLALLNSYLGRFDRSDFHPVAAMQTPKAAVAEQNYEVAADEPLTDKGRLTVGRIVSDWRQDVRTAAVSLLCKTVAGDNESPLKRAVLSSGLAQDMSLDLDDSAAQHTLLMTFKDVKDGCEEQLLTLVRDTVSALVRDGLDHAMLEANINRTEFNHREPEEPQGIRRCLQVVTEVLHGGDALNALVYDELFAELRRMLNGRAYEELLADILLTEDDRCVLYTRPSHTAGDEQRAREAEKLAAIRAAMTEEDLRANAALNEHLQAWQKTADTPEQLATLPVLPLSEVNAEPSFLPTAVDKENGVTVLRHETAANGLVHVQLYFPMTDLSLEELTEFAMIGTLLGRLPTKRHTALELQQQMKTWIGRNGVSLVPMRRSDDLERCAPTLQVNFSVLPANLAKASELICEMLLETDFSAQAQMGEIFRQMNMETTQMGVMAGHALGMMASRAGYGASEAVMEATSGHTEIRWLHAVCDALEERLPALAETYAERMAQIVGKKRLIVSVTADGPVDIGCLLDRLPEGTEAPTETVYRSDVGAHTGIRIPAQIGYACQSWCMKERDIAYHPSMLVAANILSLSYLWNVVRVQGGAYGTGIQVSRNGMITTYSYRDPTPMATLEANRGLGGYLRSFCAGDEPLDKFVISTVAGLEPLVSVQQRGITEDARWLHGLTLEKRIEGRRKLLNTTRDDLLAFCDTLDTFAAEGATCVVAHAGVLDGAEGLEVAGI